MKIGRLQTGTPTYAVDLANVLVAALKKPVKGVHHYRNEGVCSWYDFTKMIAESAGKKQSVTFNLVILTNSLVR